MPVESDYEFGKAAVTSGVLSQERLDECIEMLVALERAGSPKRLWDVVARRGYMTEAAIAKLRGQVEPQGRGPAATEELADEEEETADELPVPQAQPRGLMLVRIHRSGKCRAWPLPERVVMIDSTADSDIPLDDPDAKGQRIRVRFDEKGFMAEDAGRGTGLVINDVRMRRARLRANDLLLIGSTQLLCLEDYGDRSAPEPTSSSAVAGEALLRLVALSGKRKGASFYLGERPLVIGRSKLAGVRIFDEAVSEFHCQVAHTPAGARIADLHSRTGTRANGEAITARRLQQGDIVEVGADRFEVLFLKGAEAERSTFDVPADAEVEPGTEMKLRKRLFGEEAPADRPAPKPYRPGQLQLIGIGGPVEGKKFLITKPVTVLGRDSTAAIRITDASVSRHHAKLALEAKQATLIDGGSRNGTYLNGTRITATALRSGDTIRIGEGLFIVEEVAQKPRKPAPPARGK